MQSWEGSKVKEDPRTGNDDLDSVCMLVLNFVYKKKETTFVNQESLTWKIILLEHFPNANWFQRFQPRACWQAFQNLPSTYN